jgi:hypothetical protein
MSRILTVKRQHSPRKNFSRGAPLRGRCTPAIPARLRSERARKSFSEAQASEARLVVFASAQKLVPFDCRHYSHGTLFSRFCSLHAAQATYFDWSGQRDFIRQRQQDLHGRPFFYVFG